MVSFKKKLNKSKFAFLSFTSFLLLALVFSGCSCGTKSSSKDWTNIVHSTKQQIPLQTNSQIGTDFGNINAQITNNVTSGLDAYRFDLSNNSFSTPTALSTSSTTMISSTPLQNETLAIKLPVQRTIDNNLTNGDIYVVFILGYNGSLPIGNFNYTCYYNSSLVDLNTLPSRTDRIWAQQDAIHQSKVTNSSDPSKYDGNFQIDFVNNNYWIMYQQNVNINFQIWFTIPYST